MSNVCAVCRVEASETAQLSPTVNAPDGAIVAGRLCRNKPSVFSIGSLQDQSTEIDDLLIGDWGI